MYSFGKSSKLDENKANDECPTIHTGEITLIFSCFDVFLTPPNSTSLILDLYGFVQDQNGLVQIVMAAIWSGYVAIFLVCSWHNYQFD